MKVRPVQADYFIQVAQFLREVVLRRRHAGAKTYPQRLGDWATAMEATVLHTEHPRVYARTQEELQKRLAEIC